MTTQPEDATTVISRQLSAQIDEISQAWIAADRANTTDTVAASISRSPAEPPPVLLMMDREDLRTIVLGLGALHRATRGPESDGLVGAAARNVIYRIGRAVGWNPEPGTILDLPGGPATHEQADDTDDYVVRAAWRESTG